MLDLCQCGHGKVRLSLVKQLSVIIPNVYLRNVIHVVCTNFRTILLKTKVNGYTCMQSRPSGPIFASYIKWGQPSKEIFAPRLIESMMGLRPRQENLRLVFRLFSLMRSLPSIRIK